MKKKIIVWSLMLVLSISLIGCGTFSSTKASTEESSFVEKADMATEQEGSTTPTEVLMTVEEELISEEEDSEGTPSPSMEITPAETMQQTEVPSYPASQPPVETIPKEKREETGLSEQQKNSFSMLYYLAITAEEIRISKDNRLILDDIYTSLLNDINPGSIDETTQDHLKNLRDIIKSYINISVKRERLQYIYNQDKAATIRNAIPNPLAVLSMTNSFDWRKLAASVVYTVVDSYNNYKGANKAVDQEFLTSGWELDDEETATIQKNRERAFDYMVDIVQEYGLDGKLTLNEKAIETFAEICEIEAIQQKTRRLESEEETYKLLGNYWLELADCYYETAKYRKCLDCIDKYNELATGIYRKDYNYAHILPKVIVAAQEVYQGDDYVLNIEAFAEDIIANTNTEDWSIRYFAAQVYLDLYSKTDNREYLEDAYNIAYDNVTILLDKQCELNTIYLEDVKELELEEPDCRFLTEEEKKERQQEYKKEQKRLKAYNKALKEERKTELPPLYEPLVLNCDLLFALADEMRISYSEKTEIEAILQTDSNGVFISKVVNDRYSFTKSTGDYSIDFNKNEITIPACLLSDGAKIVVVITENDKTITFDDCAVMKVERKGKAIDSFLAHVSSKQMKDYAWTANSKVTVKIYNGDVYDPLIFQYRVKEYKDNKLIADKVVFEEE